MTIRSKISIFTNQSFFFFFFFGWTGEFHSLRNIKNRSCSLIHSSNSIKTNQKGNIRRGGLENYKILERKTPLLARASAHIFASLKQCWILTVGIFLRAFLQLAIITSLPLFLQSSFCSRSTTSFASNSIITLVKFKSIHRLIPSHSAHSFTATLVVYPMALAKPLTHSPYEFQIIPPPPALPGFPDDDPSVFSLNHILGRENHQTWMIVYGCLTLSFTPRKGNSVALDIVSSIRGLQVEFSLNITLFCLSHKHHTPNGKREPQGMLEFYLWWEVQLIRSQSNKFVP